MKLKISPDYGTLMCHFNGLRVWFCDNESNENFEMFEKRLSSIFGDGFKIDYLEIDCEKCCVSIFKVLQDSDLSFLKVSYHTFFQYRPFSHLHEFVNWLSRKKLLYEGDKPRMVRNRFYLRS